MNASCAFGQSHRRYYSVRLALTIIFLVNAAAAATEQSAIVVQLAYQRPLPEHELLLRLSVFDDGDDLHARITALQDASKPALEPLVKRYMYAAEMLGYAARSDDADARAAFRRQFDDAEAQINHILAEYRQQIDAVLADAHLLAHTCASAFEPCAVAGVAPGRYRLYAELSFATTTLRWFEAVEVKGGETVSVALTRDNLKNPFWTDLNWWRFLNLDFRKHH
jgi:hypothetical protein